MKPVTASVTVSNGRAEVLRFLAVLARRCNAATNGAPRAVVAAAGFVAKAQVSSTAINEALEES